MERIRVLLTARPGVRGAICASIGGAIAGALFMLLSYSALAGPEDVDEFPIAVAVGLGAVAGLILLPVTAILGGLFGTLFGNKMTIAERIGLVALGAALPVGLAQMFFGGAGEFGMVAIVAPGVAGALGTGGALALYTWTAHKDAPSMRPLRQSI